MPSKRRAIDLHEGDEIDKEAFQALVRAAATRNASSRRPRGKATPEGLAGRSKRPAAAKGKVPTVTTKPVLLAGDNPRIAKADGSAPVEAYLAAIPGWKQGVGRRIDELVARTVPPVRKGVRWNSPFYGIEDQGWFLAFHVFTRYVKVTFFRGTSLRPIPPGGTGKDARWIDVHEADLDEAQMARWIRQAASLPGWGGT